jgi:hypothetical protein
LLTRFKDFFRPSALFEGITELVHKTWVLRIDIRLFALEMLFDLPFCYAYTVDQDACDRLMDLYEQLWETLRIILNVLIDTKKIWKYSIKINLVECHSLPQDCQHFLMDMIDTFN